MDYSTVTSGFSGVVNALKKNTFNNKALKSLGAASVVSVLKKNTFNNLNGWRACVRLVVSVLKKNTFNNMQTKFTVFNMLYLS